MEIETRPATLADAEVISVLNREVQTKHVRAFPHMFKDGEFGGEAAAALVSREQNAVFLAAVDGEAAGYIYAEFRNLLETALTFPSRTIHIHHLSVLGRFQRRGVGRALLERVLAEAREQGRRPSDDGSVDVQRGKPRLLR